MTTLRILFYADYEKFVTPCDLGTDELKRVLQSNDDERGAPPECPENTFNIKIEITTKSRGEGPDLKRIDDHFLKNYDEIWFFLIRKKYANEDDEFNRDEIDALRRWMDKGGGVLITGDHADSGRDGPLGRGRALGKSIPRARHLRDWHAPTMSGDGRNDSTVTRSPLGMPSFQLQRDAIPQELLLPAVGRERTYHPIFYGAHNRVLDVFPDHPHEGVVTLPKKVENEEWLAEGDPSGRSPPAPEVVARGIDRKQCQLFDLMAAWDGHKVGVGRILADSSWHHYVNLNLWGLLGSAAGDRSVAAKIKNLYINQAIWLAPREIRKYIAQWLVRLLSDDSYADPVEIELKDWLHYPLAARISAPMFVDLLRDALREAIPKDADSVIEHNASFFLTHGLKELVRLEQIAQAENRELTKEEKYKALRVGLDSAMTALEKKQGGYNALSDYLEKNRPN